MDVAALQEAERLYAAAQKQRTAAAISDAIEYHRSMCENLDLTDTDLAFEFVRRVHEMIHWTPK